MHYMYIQIYIFKNPSIRGTPWLHVIWLYPNARNRGYFLQKTFLKAVLPAHMRYRKKFMQTNRRFCDINISVKCIFTFVRCTSMGSGRFLRCKVNLCQDWQFTSTQILEWEEIIIDCT